MTHPNHYDDEETVVPPRSGSFRIIETRLPTAGVDFPRDAEELAAMFATEQDCQRYLERLRWPSGFRCLACGAEGEPWRSGTGLLACIECKALLSVTHGSIFHGGAVPLRRWFQAIWEVTSSECGVGAGALQRILHVGDLLTAERCLDALRLAMTLPVRRKLRGVVDLAKTLVEVTHRAPSGRSSIQRAQVLLAVERGGSDVGQVRARYLRRVDGREAVEFVEDHVEPGAEVVTMPWSGYAQLPQAGYRHTTVAAGAIGAMPGVEQVGKLLRLWLWSTADVTAPSLQGHLDEFTFRYNRRWYPKGLLFYRLMILAALYGTADDELLGIAPVAGVSA